MHAEQRLTSELSLKNIVGLIHITIKETATKETLIKAKIINILTHLSNMIQSSPTSDKRAPNGF